MNRIFCKQLSLSVEKVAIVFIQNNNNKKENIQINRVYATKYLSVGHFIYRFIALYEILMSDFFENVFGFPNKIIYFGVFL